MTSSPDLSPRMTPQRLVRGNAAAGYAAVRLDTVLTARPGADAAQDEARAAARAEGYAVGWAEGRRAAAEAARVEAEAADAATAAEQAKTAEALAGALRALAAAADGLEQRAVTPAVELSEVVVGAAFELATALIGRELASATDPGLDAVRRALVLLPAGRPVTARLHPDDASAARAAVAAMSADVLGRDVLVIADGAVERGGAVVECDATRVDAQLGPALARVREALAL